MATVYASMRELDSELEPKDSYREILSEWREAYRERYTTNPNVWLFMGLLNATFAIDDYAGISGIDYMTPFPFMVLAVVASAYFFIKYQSLTGEGHE